MMKRRSLFAALTGLLPAAPSDRKPVATLEWLPGENMCAAVLHTRIRITPQIMNRIEQITGIDYAYPVSFYEGRVYRGDLFTWAELEPAILRAVEEAS